MNSGDWLAPASLIAILAIVAGISQFVVSVRAGNAASARQTHQDYLKLCFENPDFSSTEQFLRSHPGERLDLLIQERSPAAVKYLWFLSLMLNSLEKVLEFVSAHGAWRTLAIDQVGYHHAAIAEVWSEWKGHYGKTLTDIVEDALRAAPMPHLDGRDSATQSRWAIELLEHAREPRPYFRSLLRWLRSYRDVSVALLIGALMLLTWATTAGRDVGGSRQPMTGPAPVGPPTAPLPTPTTVTVVPSTSWGLLPWVEFLFTLVVVAVVAGWLWRRLHPKTTAEKVGLASVGAPLLASVWNWIKPHLAIELSDALHNVLAVGLLGLLGLTILALITGFAWPSWPSWGKWLRRVATVGFGILPLALLAIPSLRANFFTAIMSNGRIEAIYVVGLLAAAYLAGLLLACLASTLNLQEAGAVR